MYLQWITSHAALVSLRDFIQKHYKIWIIPNYYSSMLELSFNFAFQTKRSKVNKIKPWISCVVSYVIRSMAYGCHRSVSPQWEQKAVLKLIRPNQFSGVNNATGRGLWKFYKLKSQHGGQVRRHTGCRPSLHSNHDYGGEASLSLLLLAAIHSSVNKWGKPSNGHASPGWTREEQHLCIGNVRAFLITERIYNLLQRRERQNDVLAYVSLNTFVLSNLLQVLSIAADADFLCAKKQTCHYCFLFRHLWG